MNEQALRETMEGHPDWSTDEIVSEIQTSFSPDQVLDILGEEHVRESLRLRVQTIRETSPAGRTD